MAILLNSICLALYDYTDRESNSKKNNILELINQSFTGLFMLEALVKIIAMGFIVGSKSYLREAWNFIDFIIVIAG